MRSLLCLLVVLGGGCRRKHVAPSLLESPVVVDPPVAAPVVEDPVVAAQPEVARPAPTGHQPTSTELRARLDKLFPLIERCITQNGLVAEGPKYLLMRFMISPQTGRAMNVEIDGHAPASNCSAGVLQELRFEPWVGDPNIVAVPLTREGKPVLQSAFTDAGT